MELHNFDLSGIVLELGDDASTVIARLVPYNEKVKYGSGDVHFTKGAIQIPDGSPLTIDHGTSVKDRIGVMIDSWENTEGLYGKFKVSNTGQAQDIRTLLADGALTDVSVGVLVDNSEHSDGPMTGTLDHTSVVVHGRFGKAANPSRVLAVHDDKEPPMAEEEVAAAPVVAVYDDKELRDEIVRLSAEIDTFQNKVVDEPKLFSSMGDFVQSKLLAEDGDPAASDKMKKFALGEATTTTGAGVVPDYLSSEYISIIDTNRVFLSKVRNDPIGSSGMSVVYPKHTSGPSVAAQSSEFDEPDSTNLVIGVQSIDLITYAGANSVSQQLIKRSSPSFVDILFRELAGQYASVTDAASIAAVVAAADDTAVLADLGADASATFAAISAANTAIIAGIRNTANAIFLAPDRWAQLLELVDSEGRPLLVFGPNGPSNAQGQSSFGTMQAQYHGLPVYLDPDAATGTCLIINTDFVANLEMSPVQLSVVNVDTLSSSFGIWGLQAPVLKQDTAAATLTLA